MIASLRDRDGVGVGFVERREVRRFWGEKMVRLNGWTMNVLKEPGAGDVRSRCFVRMYRGIWNVLMTDLLLYISQPCMSSYLSHISMIVIATCSSPPGSREANDNPRVE